ncbi:hypothetical protein F2Q68_00037761 [Brassica cretica]|uniref:RING-type domain-containing protein n=1 Tax=Brassica cretica TaxID=69181 RepID=A0A8S9GYY4_BRACR|nr:hypothetical protein F2Q68_00037761 [Brassica cretica]
MTVLHRSLSDDMTNNTACESLTDCIEDLRESGSCSSTCLNYCLSICKIVSDPPPVIHRDLDHKIKKIIIITASSLITTLFLLTLLVLCLKWYNGRRRSIALSRSIEEARTRDFDGQSPAMIDHPVWHIRTIGLNPAVISSIKVCKYSKRDGVVEGTDCSVCLSEFEEEEMLRLLPKCRHAFHLSCIDTWLRSHTNCPLCRAPIVNDDDGDDIEETLVSINGDIDEETERDDEVEADGFLGIDIRDGKADKGKAANLQTMASGNTHGLTQEANNSTYEATIDGENNTDVFDDMKQRFLAFKKLKYMDNLEHFKKLADAQAPKFLVIACADSRVCPSAVLGFQPGEAFTVRNIANLVPSYESGPTETKAALQFSVNTLQVENILVIGHSRCGGIQALMSMEGEGDSRSFIHVWVIVGKKAKESTKAVASNLRFDHQCQHCEKASINHSLERLLGYPWIEERVRKGSLSLHGGYYDFVNCTFEKWTVDYGSKKEGSGIAVKNQSVW